MIIGISHSVEIMRILQEGIINLVKMDFNLFLWRWKTNEFQSLDAAIPLVPLYFGTTLPMTIHKQIGCGRVLVNGGNTEYFTFQIG